MDEMAHFDRERVPERVVHAKGAGTSSLLIVIDRVSNNTPSRLTNSYIALSTSSDTP